MTTLLKINASARRARSITRSLSDAFCEHWLARRPGDAVIDRDVGLNPPPLISEAFIAAAFTAPSDRTLEQQSVLAISEALIDELTAADVIVMATPMYNYGMPAALKAWFDQVIRIGRTFTFDLARGDAPLAPILSGKTLVLLTASGEFGFGTGEPNAAHGHLAPHVRSASRYLGVARFEHIGVEFQEFGDARFERSKREARERVPALVESLQAALPNACAGSVPA